MNTESDNPGTQSEEQAALPLQELFLAMQQGFQTIATLVRVSILYRALGVLFMGVGALFAGLGVLVFSINRLVAGGI